jgi:membrane-associated phospholipid phosphatase
MAKKHCHLLFVLLFPVCLFAQHFDIDLLNKINPDTPSSAYQHQISNSAYWLPAVVSVGQLGYGFLADDPLAKRYGVETAISVGIGQLLSAGVKHLVKRPRPYQSWPELIHPENYGTGPSFPSGHTTAAFSTAASLALSRKQWFVMVPITLWAGSVGYSRMYLGRHFPTDVFGGLLIGVASGLIGHWVTGRLYND